MSNFKNVAKVYITGSVKCYSLNDKESYSAKKFFYIKDYNEKDETIFYLEKDGKSWTRNFNDAMRFDNESTVNAKIQEIGGKPFGTTKSQEPTDNVIKKPHRFEQINDINDFRNKIKEGTSIFHEAFGEGVITSIDEKRKKLTVECGSNKKIHSFDFQKTSKPNEYLYIDVETE